MKKGFLSFGYFFLGACFWAFLVLTVFDTLYDIHELFGIVGLIFSIIALPLAIVVFPLYLLLHGAWGMALGTYIILPVLAFLFKACEMSRTN